jgi:hypothetical protein
MPTAAAPGSQLRMAPLDKGVDRKLSLKLRDEDE